MAEAFFGFLGGLLAGCLLAGLELWRKSRKPSVRGQVAWKGYMRAAILHPDWARNLEKKP